MIERLLFCRTPLNVVVLPERERERERESISNYHRLLLLVMLKMKWKRLETVTGYREQSGSFKTYRPGSERHLEGTRAAGTGALRSGAAGGGTK